MNLKNKLIKIFGGYTKEELDEKLFILKIKENQINQLSKIFFSLLTSLEDINKQVQMFINNRNSFERMRHLFIYLKKVIFNKKIFNNNETIILNEKVLTELIEFFETKLKKEIETLDLREKTMKEFYQKSKRKPLPLGGG